MKETSYRWEEFQPANLPAPHPWNRFWHAGQEQIPAWVTLKRGGRFIPNPIRLLMPKFEVIGIRFDYLQEITSADATAEGFGTVNPVDKFRATWERINAKRGFGWETNPVVAVINYRKLLTFG